MTKATNIRFVFEGREDETQFDTQNEMELAQRFSVMSIPTLILFKNGEIVNQMVGVQPKAVIEQMIQSV